jgi:uncharacterized protein YndB with AHSA1/START domain
MKSIIKGIVLFLMALVVMLVCGATLLPPVAHVERAAMISAPPEAVYAVAADLRKFRSWSPWLALDPDMQQTVEGPETGVGQTLTWASNNPNVGKGTQAIVEAVPNQKLVTDLDMGEMGKARTVMTLTPADGGTAVVWSFEAPLDGVLGRWIGLMYDSSIGADYEAGLVNLKRVVEQGSAGG